MRLSTAWCRAAGRPEFTPLAGPRAAQLIVVAPATTDFLARAYRGRADNQRSACLLGTTAPLVRAMNHRMWKYPQVRRRTDAADAAGNRVPGPGNGALAVSEGRGAGRVPEPETILAECDRLLEPPTVLEGRAVVGAAGPTRDVPLIPGLNLLRVETTMERRDAVEQALPGADALIMAAEPTDYTTASLGSGKIKRAAIEDRAGLSDRVEVLFHGR